jgi:hypothetical protein
MLGVGGRNVRCAKCRHQWRAMAPLITLPSGESGGESERPIPDSIKPIPVPIPVNVVESFSAAGAEQRPYAKRNAIIIGLVAALVVVAPVFIWRFSGVKGNAVAAEKTELKKVIALDGTPSTRLTQEDGHNVLKIEGAVINHDATRRKTPKLIAQGLNAKGAVIKEWNIPLTAEELEPAQRLPFSFSTPFSEQGVVDIAFHFI